MEFLMVLNANRQLVFRSGGLAVDTMTSILNIVIKYPQK